MEAFFDLTMKQNADQARGDRRDDEERRITHARAVAAQQAAGDAPEAGTVQHQHGPERRHMQRHFHGDVREMNPGQRLHQHEMPGARDREEFREPLHQPQHNPLPERHATRPATSATIPTSIAPLSRRLFPWVRPVNNRLATASTTSWANRAMRKYAPW